MEPIVFLRAIARQWVSLITGGFLIALLWLWQGLGHAIPRWIYGLVAAGAFLPASYRVWLAEYRLAKNSAIEPSPDARGKSQPPGAPQPMPNVRPLDIRATTVDTSNLRWEEVEDGFPAIKAGFFNDILPGHPVGTVLSARPHVVFRGAAGGQIGDVTSCAWLGTTLQRIQLDPGESSWFCLLVYLEGRWCIPFLREVRAWNDDGTLVVSDTAPLRALGSISVEISLIGQNGTSFARQRINLLLSDAGEWRGPLPE